MFRAMPDAAARDAEPRPTRSATPEPQPQTDAPSGKPAGVAAAAEAQRRPTNPEQAAVRTAARGEIELPGFGRRAATSTPGIEAAAAKPSADSALAPPDRLCVLLREARALAALTLEERPASTGWVLRSAAYRAVYEFKDVLPDAVASLYRASVMGRDPGSPRTAAPTGSDPSLRVMEQIIVARGQLPREQPLAIEPMTSAAQAKEHVGRFLLEIEHAPGDAALRHFLALGALTELLVRTKLPPQTEKRLRDIVAHAQREGPKGPAIDLMMTALKRINA
jgi:hypothetical protein